MLDKRVGKFRKVFTCLLTNSIYKVYYKNSKSSVGGCGNLGKYFAGVDAGGTITKIVVADEMHHVLFHKEVPNSVNFYGMSYQQAKDNLKQLFLDVLNETGISAFESICIGMSAFYEEPGQEFQKDFAGFIDAKNILIDSDLRIALECMEDKRGIMVISGTGSMLAHLHESGQVLTVGGFGHVIGDEGSAYHMAIAAIRAAIRDEEGWGEKTLLTEYLKAFYTISDIHQLIDIIHNLSRSKSSIADFAINLDVCARQNDSVAIRILRREGTYLFLQLGALIHKIGYTPKTVYYYGGVLMKSNIVRDTFLKKVEERYRGTITVRPLDSKPEFGALALSYRITEGALK